MQIFKLIEVLTKNSHHITVNTKIVILMQNQQISTIHGHPQGANFKHQNTQRLSGKH